MPNKHYRKGYRHEKKSAVYLRNLGYEVIESRGSHGPWDLVADGPDDSLRVQVKSGKVRVSKKEWSEMQRWPRPAGNDIVYDIHWWPRKGMRVPFVYTICRSWCDQCRREVTGPAPRS